MRGERLTEEGSDTIRILTIDPAASRSGMTTVDGGARPREPQGMMNQGRPADEVTHAPSFFFDIRRLTFLIRYSFPLFALHLLLSSVSAQSLKPRGYFSADTVKVGEPVHYTLTFRYPRNLEVVFPGEEAQYVPFEYLDRTFFPTRSDSL